MPGGVYAKNDEPIHIHLWIDYFMALDDRKFADPDNDFFLNP